MIEINMNIEICDSRTPTLGTLSMISLEVDFVNIYYNIFNDTAIIYIGILQYLIVHRPTAVVHNLFRERATSRFLNPFGGQTSVRI